jgi:hypothetical protein
MALSKIRDESTDGSVAGGKVLQVVQSVNKYNHSVAGAQDTDYVIQSASSTDWEPSISISANSKVLINIMLSTVTSAADPFQMFRLERKIDSGSYTDVDKGVANDSRVQSFAGFRTRSTDNYAQTPISFTYLDDPNQSSACTVTYRIISRQGAGSTRISYFNYATATDNEAGTFLSTCALQEIADA